MASTYEPIYTTTLSSSASSITFSSVPQTYTDIIVSTVLTSTGGNQIVGARFNSDTGSNYSRTGLRGVGSAAETFTFGNESYLYSIAFAYPYVSNSLIHIMNYSNTTTYKTILSRHNAAQNVTEVTTGLWRNTNAISTISLTISGNDFASGSTFTFYGIKAA